MGKTLKNPFNEVESKDAGKPDISGGGLYGSYSEVIANQGSREDASFKATPNSKSGCGIMGGPAKNEPNPAGMSTTNEDKY
jgi:hypothetical protein